VLGIPVAVAGAVLAMRGESTTPPADLPATVPPAP